MNRTCGVTGMTPERWQQIKAIFDEVDPHPPSERSGIISQMCGGDDELRLMIEQMFEEIDDGFIGNAIVQESASLSAFTDAATAPPESFGRYRIIRRIGQGGMGAVYEATRVDDFRKKVAIKIIKHEFDSNASRTRFQQERQMLAVLEHPNIARLIDGGESESGSPYLVLEFVDGVPISEYCAKLDRKACLRLFMKVCDAVDYAHRNLIIHRDLKPGNILVTESGEPKLLDFGIAKLMDPSATLTQTSMIALTPEYASPEQVRGEPISTASDVYSLGVVLYQILTGRKPYTLHSVTALEMDRVVCQLPPAPPGLGDELDDILMMALRKEPERRYRGVREFAEDIGRYLNNEAVRARPDTILYRARKYVRRRWLPIAATAMVAVALTGGVVASQYQARIAQQRFEQVRRLAHSFVFDFDDDIARLAGSTAVREKMVKMALEYLDNLSKSAGSDLGLQKELAAAYQKVGDAQGYPARPSLGHTAEAVASYRKAAAMNETIAAKDPSYVPQLGRFYTAFATLLRYTHDYPEASRMAESALRSEAELANQKPDDEAAQIRLARVWFLLGDISDDSGHTRKGLEKNRAGDAIAQAILTRWRNRDALDVAQAGRARVGTTARASGHLDESLKALNDAKVLIAELLRLEPQNPAYHRAEAVLAQFLSSVYDDDREPSLEDPARCLQYSRQYLDFARGMVKRDPANASAQFSLAVALYRISFPLKFSDPGAAIRAARESVQSFDEQIAAGKSSFLVISRRARALRRLSEALVAGGQVKEAGLRASEALAEQRKIASSDVNDVEAAHYYVQALVAAADATDNLKLAGEYLAEAEQKSSATYARSPDDMVAAVHLALVREAAAAHARKSGDEARAARSTEAAGQVWREFPERNDYVRRKLAGR